MNNDLKNIIIAIGLSTIILLAWQYYFVIPNQPEISTTLSQNNNSNIHTEEPNFVNEENNKVAEIDDNILQIKIASKRLSGKLSLKGLRFNDLTLKDYKKTIDPHSDDVKLLNHSTNNIAFAQFGWLKVRQDMQIPDKNTVWQADRDILRENETVNLTWRNNLGIIFKFKISLDENYMFTIKQSVVNESKETLGILPYGLIYRVGKPVEKPIMVFHEGAIGVFSDVLKEKSFSDIVNDKVEKFKAKKGGWIGFTDKYWLTAMIPDNFLDFETKIYGEKINDIVKYQIDFVGPKIIIPAGESFEVANKFFAGAKEAKLLNYYQDKHDIKLFDRAIDYGWFYFLTKPMFSLLSTLYSYVGNFGIAILIMTLLIKLLMFPIANKSFKTMKRMKDLQPKIAAIKERYGDDQMRLNKEMMDLYKKEKLSPVSGCLPLLIQIPVFFSLYKVIFISIEMRHAPFYGWIKDLSAPDPTSILNLFGLLPFETPAIITIGAWPIIMGLTMILQQKMSPEPTDPIQAKVMKFLPYIFIFMFQSFPAGLMIYWSFSNLLSIIQQSFINKIYGK